MMVDWTAPDPTTPAQATTKIGSTDNAWYNGTSYGQLGLSGTATPWMTIADPTQGGTTCDLGQIELEAEAAAQARGYAPAGYDHEMIYIPIGTPGCNVWAGQGEVNGRITWIYGYMAENPRATTHELGHNLGLWHSHSLTCHNPLNGSIYVPFSSACDPFSEYGDTWDDMGELLLYHDARTVQRGAEAESGLDANPRRHSESRHADIHHLTARAAGERRASGENLGRRHLLA